MNLGSIECSVSVLLGILACVLLVVNIAHYLIRRRELPRSLWYTHGVSGLARKVLVGFTLALLLSYVLRLVCRDAKGIFSDVVFVWFAYLNGFAVAVRRRNAIRFPSDSRPLVSTSDK